MNIDNKTYFVCTLYSAVHRSVFYAKSRFNGVANCFKEQNKPKHEKISEYAQIYLANKLYSQQPNGP